MQTVTIDYFGVQGQGRNVTEAKRDAGAKIAHIVKHSPMIWSHNGYSMVVSANAYGWVIQIIHPDSKGRVMSSSTSGGDEESAVSSAIRHLLSMTRKIGDYTLPAWLPGHIDTKALVADWKRDDGFQLAYRAAQAAGEVDPHSWACMNGHQFAA